MSDNMKIRTVMAVTFIVSLVFVFFVNESVNAKIARLERINEINKRNQSRVSGRESKQVGSSETKHQRR